MRTKRMRERRRTSAVRRVLLAEDHALVRKGVRDLIEERAGYSVVGEAIDGVEAIELAKKLRPDILIMDIGLPRMNGLNACRHIRELHPALKVIILSMYADREYVAEAVRQGVSGYLLKDGAADEILCAMDAVSAGKRYLSPALSDVVAEVILAARPAKVIEGWENLTKKEKLILTLISEGTGRSEIAKRMHISPETVKTHRRNILTKLKLRSTADLAALAVKEFTLKPA
ncbi:MAG: response regulator transcription factor [Chlamydiae bacterium]|nr:response regulator transcription factor [Chlamydiota bacterium]